MDVAHLNPPQREAVLHTDGPLLVLAGAGSGKTRVITHRIARLISDGVPATSIAALTFTNKAAAEMRERVAHLVPNAGQVKDLTVGTFHSLGLGILKKERKQLGFPRGFVIYDTADQLGIIRELLRRIDAGRRFDVKAILTRISLAKNAFVSPDDYDPLETDDYDEITAELYPRYQQALRAYAAVDFDDLITETVRLMQGNEEVGERWRNRFRFVLVDEYQDTNRAQLLFVKQLVAQHNNLCVVGDDDQSIYSWRGADPSNILGFAKMFPGAKVVKLEQNYRSSSTILAAANAVIVNNEKRHDKKLWTARPSSLDVRIHSAVAPDAASEAKFVAQEIDSLRKDNVDLGDVAVLYRSNKQTRLLEEELRTHEIPYKIYGGQQFFERKEVKDVIAYLRIALNQRDEISLRRIVNYPSRGIGTTSILRVSEWASSRKSSMWNALVKVAQNDDIRPSTKNAIAEFTALIIKLREAINSHGVVQATRELMEDIDLYGDLRASTPSITAAQRRIDNVEFLLRSLQRHEERKVGKDALLDYLRQLSLESSDDEKIAVGAEVSLTTLHGSKGLEFPIVFLIGLEEELLPHVRTLMPQATDVNDPDHVSDVTEERRLAYVGITRAKDKLYLTRSAARQKHGKIVPRTPSRFLLEIPGDLIEERDIAAEAEAPVETEEVRSFFQSFGAQLDLD